MQMRSKVWLAAGTLAVIGGLGLAGAGFAHDRGQGRHGEHHRGGPSMHHGKHHGGGGMWLMKTFDANGDGVLSQDEIDQVRGAQLQQFDANGDGQLDLEEYQALWLDAMRERMVDRFQDHDDDGDGVVTEAEFLEPFANIVVRMDRDGDGQLSWGDRGRGRGDGDRPGRGPGPQDAPAEGDSDN